MSIDINVNYDDIVIAKDRNNGKEYYVIIEQDNQDGIQWSQHEDPIGHLITWHRNYVIGETHDYGDSEDLFIDMLTEAYQPVYRQSEAGRKNSIEYSKLLMKYSDTRIITNKEAMDWAEKNASDSVEESKDSPYFVCLCKPDGTILERFPVSTNNIEDMTLDDLGWMWEIMGDNYLSCKQLKDMIDGSDKFAIYPIFMYEHSGIALSVSNACYPFNDRWDAGQLGWWYITKDEALKQGCNENTWKQDFLKIIESRIDEANYLESCNCWGFICAPKDGVDEDTSTIDKKSVFWSKEIRSSVYCLQIDSCWGYIGYYENMLEEYCDGLNLEITGVLE